METLVRDIRYGIRMMTNSPGFTAVAVLALALGIGANTAIFSVVNAVLLRPFPYPEPDRLVQIWGSNPERGVPFHNVFYADASDWRKQSRSFEYMSAATSQPASLVIGEVPESVLMWRVNASFFPMLGVQLQAGRAFAEEEDRPGGPRVVVMSHELWTRRFGSNPSSIGSAVLLDRLPYTVVGILKPGFTFAGRKFDLFAPIAASDSRSDMAGAPTVTVYARLNKGVSVRQAQAEMNGIGGRLAQMPRTIGTHPRVWGLRDFVVRDVRLSLIVLLAAVGLVLLIACANVANLMLARAGARQRELALRAALGAGRRRIFVQLLTESSLLGLAGGLTGVLFAFWGVRLLLRLTPERYPLLDGASIDGTVLLFTLVLSVATGVIFGFAPALALSRTNVSEALKEGSQSSGEGVGRTRLRAALVVSEVALALVLLAGAGLMLRSFVRLNSVGPGFSAEGVLTASISLPDAKYHEPQSRMAFWRQLLENLRAAPGVVAAGVVSSLPLTQHNTGTACIVEGRPFPSPSEMPPIVWFRVVNPDYFRSMGIPLRSGRTFTDKDAGGPRVAVINETMARRHWPGQDPIGKRFTDGLPRPGQEIRWITVIGVVGDVRHKGMDVEPDAETFWPYQQYAPGALTLTIRTATGATQFAPVLRKAVSAVDKDQPVSQVRSMEQIVFDSIAPQRISVTLIGIFAAVALILAAVGIYGVISFSVARRTREIGVRMALGARGVDVVRLVILEALTLAGVGLVIGIAAALALTRFLSSLLFGVNERDPLILIGVTAALLCVAAVASYLPARRAASVDPIEALHCE